MFQLLYISTAKNGLLSHDIHRILGSAQKRNESHGITGILFYNGLSFLQILEGDKWDVDHIYSRICKDERHHTVQLKFAHSPKIRSFPSWSMASTGSLSEKFSQKIEAWKGENQLAPESVIPEIFAETTAMGLFSQSILDDSN